MSQPTSSPSSGATAASADGLSVHRTEGPGPVATGARQGSPADASVGQLVSDLTQHMSRLVRDEVALAQMDLKEKGKKAGLGIGAFSVAGLLAFFGVGAVVTTAILALSLVVSPWLAALIVAVVLFALAAVAGLVGKKEIEQATPPVPEAAVEGVKKDVDAVKEGFRR